MARKFVETGLPRIVPDADRGRRVLAPPISYRLNGRQYVSVITGTGVSFGTYSSIMGPPVDYRTQAHRVLTFALGGKAQLPPATPALLTPVDDPGYRDDPAGADRGAVIYGTHCYYCHGNSAIAAGTAPDLRTSPAILDPAVLRAIVHEGALTGNGMPRFEELSDANLADLRTYLRQQAQAWRSKGH